MTWITEIKTLRYILLLMAIGILLDGVSTIIALNAFEEMIELNPIMSLIEPRGYMIAFSMTIRAAGLALTSAIINIRADRWTPSWRIGLINGTLILCLIVLFGIIALNFFQIYLCYADTITVIELPKGLTI